MGQNADRCRGWCDPNAVQVILRFDSIDQLLPHSSELQGLTVYIIEQL